MEKKYVITETEMRLVSETFYGKCMGCDVSNECEGCPEMSEESIQKFWESRELSDQEELLALNREFAQTLVKIAEESLTHMPHELYKTFEKAREVIEDA